MLPCGFSTNGMPLGMQLIGPPTGDLRVLQAGHAFQSTTDWHRRRASLEAGETLAPPDLSANEPRASSLTAAEQSHVEAMARQAGLKLNDRQMAILMETAPHALEMARRFRKSRDCMEQPSLVFRFD